ncbi:hypothetical protein [Rhodovarius lipocyclicus]|uniref:hypothetical protein n=1 Tax=Rhodovarius lipocyclicus TaxID=268410 RepID=UPI001F231526|nr:hypothetical protein [Rhodovarius lipocyclicus]
MRRSLYLTLFLAWPAAAQNPPPQDVGESFGTWRLGCMTDRMTDRTACMLRHQDWVERPGGGPGLALEIQERGGRLVPVVTARELGLDGASRGLMALAGKVQLRLGRNAMIEMSCGLEGRTLSCFPRAEEAERMESELRDAPYALVRPTGLGAGGSSPEPVELPLSGTAQAMARYRQFVPPGPVRTEEGTEFRDFMGRMQRLFQ